MKNNNTCDSIKKCLSNISPINFLELFITLTIFILGFLFLPHEIIPFPNFIIILLLEFLSTLMLVRSIIEFLLDKESHRVKMRLTIDAMAYISLKFSVAELFQPHLDYIKISFLLLFFAAMLVSRYITEKYSPDKIY
jgi:hypothetical protein